MEARIAAVTHMAVKHGEPFNVHRYNIGHIMIVTTSQPVVGLQPALEPFEFSAVPTLTESFDDANGNVVCQYSLTIVSS